MGLAEDVKARIEAGTSPFTADELKMLKTLDPVTYRGIVKDIVKVVGKSNITKGDIDQLVKGFQVKEEVVKEVVSPQIHKKALDILKHGDPIQHIADSCGKSVLGAEKAFKKLVCCVSDQNIKDSRGLHIKLNGESGGGKSYVVYTFAHHLPAEAVSKGNGSNMSIFYHNEGNRIFRIIDDYRAGNSTLDTIMKQTTTLYHQEYAHPTVINGEPVKLYAGSEQTWVITSVDGVQDIQCLNRQLPVNVDDSKELTTKVNSLTIEVSREIFRILRDTDLIGVRVPYYKRIKWLNNRNRRDPSIFMDVLIAITAMNRFQRKQDSEGYYLATEEDFRTAVGLFTDKDAEELVHRLTKPERKMLELLSQHPEGLDRSEISKHLGVGENRVTQIIRGERGNEGLMDKITGLSYKKESISTSFGSCSSEDSIPLYDEKRTYRERIVYRLEGYDPISGMEAVVTLLDSE